MLRGIPSRADASAVTVGAETFTTTDTHTDLGFLQSRNQFGTVTTYAPTDAGNGRLIPTTSVEQYAATMASWMGVGASDLRLILPNLPNFATDTLGFMA